MSVAEGCLANVRRRRRGAVLTAVTGGTCVVRRLVARPQHVLLFADREMSNQWDLNSRAATRLQTKQSSAC